MESLSDIVKSISDRVDMSKLEQRQQQVLAHAEVRKLLERYPQIGEPAALRAHLPRLYQYASEFDACSNCPGLDRCPNDMTGHYTRLAAAEAAGRLQLCDYKVACRKWTSRETEDAVRGRIRSFYVDDRALQDAATPEQLVEFDQQRAKAVARLFQYIDQVKREGLTPKGLYLVGGFGTGKTYLTGYLLRELSKSGYSGVIVYMPDFVEDLKAMFQEPHRLKDTIEMMKETDLLVFDDIGAENMNPWLRDHVLGSILNYRMNRKPTFYTSNYDLERLEAHFSFTSKEGEDEGKGQRLMERIRPFVDVVAVSGSNKRGVG